MAHYVVSGKQLVSSTLMIAIFIAACAWFGSAVFAYFDLPEIWVGADGKCVKVINYRNGDGYTCQDKDIVLRKYKVINVQ